VMKAIIIMEMRNETWSEFLVVSFLR
jgi:hypothetical protein